ncbi:fungal specific transcription factor [Colletotrichum karsti]|uniref:Fungal specific transcription factor n=1 Tax=Colletotrichum karsti TaxID=1095194 RepID=A0A9P6IDE5_9PEZI|nr:fungal specific transcription factor [Colletotrichum karsti]KAF9880803.1 fungal specific transcription factor [Colletotrichum karsti]
MDIASRFPVNMSVVYEPRNFMHDGSYPNIGDPDHDHNGDPTAQYQTTDVPDLSSYSATASMLGDDRSLMPDGLGDDPVGVPDATRLDLSAPPTLASLPSSLPPALPEPLPSNNTAPHKDDAEASTPSSRVKCIPKPEREVTKQADGKFYCTFPNCTEETQVFTRKCEWSKHMDKHERPYRCGAEGCEKLPGFTYSGGLLRHEREVHGKHGGPKNTVNCPHPNCKRHTGKGFSRQENLNEHLRRVHTSDGTVQDDIQTGSDGDSDKGLMGSLVGLGGGGGNKRKRSRKSSDAGLEELREEVKRVRHENEELRQQLERQSQHSFAMMAQIAELQDTLRANLESTALGAPTATML